jgi:4-amino-4-deoxy-L-arabinose transferase-like glycosyltransferase
MKFRQIPLFLLLLSLCVRFFYYFLDNPIIGSDAAEYVKLARRLAVGDFAEGLSVYWAPLLSSLIAIPSIFTDSYLLPTLIVSFITGSFAPIATYYLIKQSYGQREAVIAAIIAVFYPHLLRSTFNFGTENIYLLLIISSIIIFWQGLRRDSGRSFFLTGILLGLGYLTRPEAFGYLLFFIPWLGLDKILSGQKVFSRKLFRNAFILFFGFALLAAPYIFYLRSATGNWTISGKFARHVVGDEVFSDRKRLYNEALESPQFVTETGKIFVKLTLYNLHNIHKKFPYLFPPLLLVFVGLGLFRTKWNGTRFKREIFLLSFCAVTVLGYALTVNEVPYFYVLLPILIGWIARGIVEMENWWRESVNVLSVKKLFTSGFPLISILFIILINIYVFPLNSFMRSRADAWEWSPYEQKKAGLWLKETAKRAPIIMSADFRPAFYAEGEHVALSSNSFEKVLAEAVSKRVDFLVIDERNIKAMPQLIGLLNEPQNYPQLEMVYQASEQPGYKIVIYRVKSAALALSSETSKVFNA